MGKRPMLRKGATVTDNVLGRFTSDHPVALDGINAMPRAFLI
jgi:hypothetical protein